MAHTKVTKTYSQNTGTANTFSYSGSFDVFKGTEVVALLDNVLLTYTASTINESASPREYTVDTSAKTIHIGGANLSSGTIIIRPETDMGAPTPRADYTPGASITSADLNNNQLQLMRKAMEYDEQKLASTGDTMTGDLTMGEDTTIVFEGATDDAYETTLTVTDPTADRTITLPNVSGTVVTTGDTATVTATMLAANSVDSSELVDGSIDSSHIANDQVDSQHYAGGSIDLEHMSANSVDSDQYVDGSIDTAHIAADAITGAKIADNSIGHEHIAADAVNTGELSDSAVTTAKIAADAVTGAKIADNSIGHEHIAAGAVNTGELAADAVTGAKIADDTIDSEHYAAGSIDLEHMSSASVDSDNIVDDTIVNADINSSAAIAHSKLANVSSGQVIVGNGSNVPTAVAMSGDVAIAAGGATTIQANSVEIGMIGCEQTTISDSDSHIPTSGAVVDYVAAQIAPIGGLEVIADDESFPNTIPNAGVVISIADAAGLQVNSSGVSTNGDALDNSTITINGFPSELRGGVNGNADPYVFASGAGLMVQSTGSSHTYNYHQALIREADFVQLSDDISDFNSRYRIGTKTADNASSNDDGDLFFDTGANKMYVYDGAYNSGGAWKEVTSAGDFKILTVKDHDQASGGSGPTFNGSNEEFDLFDSSADASITSAQQLIVSLNGVIQKPNAGTFSGSEEGFYLNDTHGIKFCDPPPSGSVLFVTQIGSAVALNEPADGTVTAAKIASGAVNLAKMAVNSIDSDQYVDGSIDHVHLAADIVDGDNIADDAVGAEHIEVLDADLQMNGANITLQDSGSSSDDRIVLGAGSDLNIYHDGTDSHIRNNEGKLIITNEDSGGDDLHLRGKADEESIVCSRDGAVELYHDNIKTFETISEGARVQGNEGASAVLELWADQGDDNADKWRLVSDQSSNYFYLQNYAAGSFETSIRALGNGAVELYYDNALKFETKSAGCALRGTIHYVEGLLRPWSATNTDLGTDSDRWRDIYIYNDIDMKDFGQILLGDSDDLRIYHSTDNRFDSYGQNVKFVNKNADGGVTENMLTMSPNGAVSLYHDGNFKCASTADGFEVGDFGTAGDVYGTEVRVDGGVRTSTATTAFQYMTRFYNPNGQVGYIAVQNSATTFSTSGSDRDLKKNFESWDEDVSSLFKKVNPQKFNFKTEEDSTAKTKGFIAQEMVDSFPEAYVKNPEEGEDAKYYFNPSGMVVYLTKALQEAITKIETLETKVAALEAG